MNWLGYVIGAAIIIFFIVSVISFVKSIIAFVEAKKNKGKAPDPEPDVNDLTDNSDKEV